jgi:hypothetical protein
VAHLVAKDPGGLLVMSRRGGDRGKVHPRDGQDAVCGSRRSSADIPERAYGYRSIVKRVRDH